MYSAKTFERQTLAVIVYWVGVIWLPPAVKNSSCVPVMRHLLKFSTLFVFVFCGPLVFGQGSPGDSKTLVVFTSPKEIHGVTLLSINQRGIAGRQYIYTPATQRVRSVVPQERSARFIGTDFTFEDVGERVLDDFSYRLIGGSEMMDGHESYKVEATPVDQSRSQYKFIYYWVAQDVPVILYAEFYDGQGREVRILHASAIKRVNGIWGARHTEMRTLLDGTRTVLTIDDVKFNTKPDEKLFTPQGLAEAGGSGTAK